MSAPEERSWARAVLAVLVRPQLWWTALRVVGRSSPKGWWHRPPFLPRPPAEFVAFRLETQYGGAAGDASTAPESGDLVAYLAWCRSLDRGRRHRSGTSGLQQGGWATGRHR